MTEIADAISTLAHQNAVVLARLTETPDHDTYVTLRDNLGARISELETLTDDHLNTLTTKTHYVCMLHRVD